MKLQKISSKPQISETTFSPKPEPTALTHFAHFWDVLTPTHLQPLPGRLEGNQSSPPERSSMGGGGWTPPQECPLEHPRTCSWLKQTDVTSPRNLRRSSSCTSHKWGKPNRPAPWNKPGLWACDCAFHTEFPQAPRERRSCSFLPILNGGGRHKERMCQALVRPWLKEGARDAHNCKMWVRKPRLRQTPFRTSSDPYTHPQCKDVPWTSSSVML